MSARISAIFTCAKAGAPMSAAAQVSVAAGEGIAGDRYALGVGAYSKIEPIKARDVTFIAEQGIDAANAALAAKGLLPFAPVETRRNLLVSGMSAEALNALVGQDFTVGAIRFHGLELADPCMRPGRLINRPGFEESFAQRGGLRARVLSGGVLAVGDVFAA